ncbi:AraC family transcriptional regulator [Pseudomonadota bacterium]
MQQREKTRLSLGTTSIPPVQQYLEAGRGCGVDISQALKHADISFAELNQLQGRISGDKFQRLLIHLIDASEQPLFGLHSARFVQPDSFSVLGEISQQAEDLSQALKESMPLEKLVGDMGVTEFRVRHHGLKMIWHCQYSHLQVIPQMIDNVLASWVNYARWLLGNEQASPLEVHLQKAAPPLTQQQQYQAFFHCPVKFKQKQNALLIPHSLLTHPLSHANLSQLKQLHERARQQLSDIDETNQIRLNAARIIRRLLTQEKIQRDKVASHMHMSGRSLQRKLLTEGISFQQLLDQVRYEMADYWLEYSKLSMVDISLQLGFSDVRVFFRAYKQWSGQSPGQSRLEGLR